MNYPVFLSAAFFMLFSWTASAQCPPPGFPEPGNTCPQAPILCPNIDGYCSTINNNNLIMLFPCCGPSWTLNNDEWFGFFAGTSTITIEIVPQNCTPGNMMGLQGAIFADCPINNNNSDWCTNNLMSVQCACTEDPFLLSSSNFVVGQVYWIVLDGCNGNICDYTVHVLEGSTVGFAPGNPGVISGLSQVCQNASSDYSVAVPKGATSFDWTLSPANAGKLLADNEFVSVMWADSFTGIAQLCIATANTCYQNADQSCLDIEVKSAIIREENIFFCRGDSVRLNGQVYTQSGAIRDTLSSALPGGCDTIRVYNLHYFTPSPSVVTIQCPVSILIEQAVGGGAVVNYDAPSASSDCICPGIDISLSQGLPSGSLFPAGITNVCYTARDSCGQSASCCFEVNIETMVDEEEACDTKINGCVKYELLTITEDAGKNRTYRVRITNNCSNKLINTAIQAPDGLVPIAPANFSTYTAPSGNTYLVRNPNYSPHYSVRFSSVSDSINNGESDIFKYTLPAQANVTFIHVVSRLAPYVFVSAHLNTFYCPIGITPSDDRPLIETTERRNRDLEAEPELLVFPNPASQVVQVMTGMSGHLQVLDQMGRVVFSAAIDETGTEFSVKDFPQGLYQVVFAGARNIQYCSLSIQH